MRMSPTSVAAGSGDEESAATFDVSLSLQLQHEVCTNTAQRTTPGDDAACWVVPNSQDFSDEMSSQTASMIHSDTALQTALRFSVGPDCAIIPVNSDLLQQIASEVGGLRQATQAGTPVLSGFCGPPSFWSTHTSFFGTVSDLSQSIYNTAMATLHHCDATEAEFLSTTEQQSGILGTEGDGATLGASKPSRVIMNLLEALQAGIFSEPGVVPVHTFLPLIKVRALPFLVMYLEMPVWSEIACCSCTH